ncbi:MAG: polysaccharide deacetylase family protein [Betaproteobacteria bacterium]
MKKSIALKIDVDTYRGTQSGVPALIELLQRSEAQGTFFFSLGSDQSGREPRSSSLKRYYDLRTRLKGRLLPGPDIGSRSKDVLRQTQQAGFEVGIHAWNRVQWEQNIHRADNPWVEGEMCQACLRFADIFPDTPKAHAAAGWIMNRHALRLTQRLDFSYASDCRGTHPFIPVIDGEIVACPQLPTTLPTLDEMLAQDAGLTPELAVDRILERSIETDGDHVFTLRAELEGMKFTAAFERLLVNWKNQGIALVSLRDIRASLDLKNLPRHVVKFSEIAGRPGLRMTQGPVFLGE